MSERIESLEDKIMGVAVDNKKAAEEKPKQEETKPKDNVAETTAGKEMVDTIAVPQAAPVIQNGIPVYYQLPVVDASGHVVQRLPIERSVRKEQQQRSGKPFLQDCHLRKSQELTL